MTVIALSEGQAELPSKDSTQSYWHTEPSQLLLGHRTTEDLPVTADVVVVGSGITGAFAARELLADGRNVLMLEAREACWGATGRNGGHCQPAIYTTTPEIARFELATFYMLDALVRDNQIACDWQVVGGVHSITDPEVLRLVEARLTYLATYHTDLASKARLVTDKEELAQLRVPQVLGAVVQSHAAKCWPYKLVAWVLESLLRLNYQEIRRQEHFVKSELRFNLQTTTPVQHLQKTQKNSWIVHTPRGQVEAKTVLLATNGYLSYLIPSLTDVVVPVRGQVCALKPPSTTRDLFHTHVFSPEHGDDYLVQREEGDLILGGQRLSSRKGEVGISRDDKVNPAVGRALRRAMYGVVKLRQGGDEDPQELEAECEWTGIMGFSKDGCPWVGKLPESLGGMGEEDGGIGDGLYVCAGYSGHGMSVAARCGVAVAQMITGKSSAHDKVNLPSSFQINFERAAQACLYAFEEPLTDLKTRLSTVLD